MKVCKDMDFGEVIFRDDLARVNTQYLTGEDMARIQEYIETTYPGGLYIGDLERKMADGNEFAQVLGFPDWDAFCDSRNSE